MYDKQKFVVREFQEVSGGYYDEYGFYNTPNGSKLKKINLGFWDEQGYYFNRQGFDQHGGYYDDNFNYVRGNAWDNNNQCYYSEIEGDNYLEDEGEDYDDFDTMGFENFKKVHGERDDDFDEFSYQEIYDEKQNIVEDNVKSIENNTNKINLDKINKVTPIEINPEIVMQNEGTTIKGKNKLDGLFDNPSTVKTIISSSAKAIVNKTLFAKPTTFISTKTNKK